MKYCFVLVFAWFTYFDINTATAKSVKLRTVTPKPKMATVPLLHQRHYQRVKPTNTAVRSPVRRSEIVRQFAVEGGQSIREESQDILQNTFNNGIRRISGFLQRFISRYFGSDTPESFNENKLRIPGFPKTPIFHQLDVSSVVKLLQATDGSQAEILAESAVIDIVSQLAKIIGFNDLRDWLAIFAMYFVLGPILIPLFWLPISLFGMAGLLVPLFVFNPPSKLNTGVTGHDPLEPENEVAHERSFSKFLSRAFSTFSNSKSFRTSIAPSSDIFESCKERVSCHLTRLYRDNPISQWLSGRFNVTKIEWARIHPGDDYNDNGISSREDCKKYACSVFPAA